MVFHIEVTLSFWTLLTHENQTPLAASFTAAIGNGLVLTSLTFRSDAFDHSTRIFVLNFVNFDPAVDSHGSAWNATNLVPEIGRVGEL